MALPPIPGGVGVPQFSKFVAGNMAAADALPSLKVVVIDNCAGT